MQDLLNLIQSQMSDQALSQLANQMGGNVSKEKASSAVNNGAAILMNALSKNASNKQGASALDAALDKDHDGSILDDLAGFLGGSSPVANSRAANGAGILNHVLGAKQGGAIEALSQMSGLNKNQSSSMLMKLAPIVLGALGKQKRSAGLGANDLGGLLSGAASMANQKASKPDLITSLLDRDGDGNITNEATSLGLGLLKKFFNK